MSNHLLAVLLGIIASSSGLGTVLPFLLNPIVQRFPTNEAKKHAAWVACLAVAVGLAASNGAFSPVIDLWQSTRPTTLVGVVKAVWASGAMLVSCFGILQTVTSTIYDKFAKPVIDAATGNKPAETQTVTALLQSKATAPYQVADFEPSSFVPRGVDDTLDPSYLAPHNDAPGGDSTPGATPTEDARGV